MKNEIIYLHAFNTLPQLGSNRLKKISNFFESPQKAFNATTQYLLKAGIEPEIIELWRLHKQTLNLDEEIEKLEKSKIKLLSSDCKNYPKLLLEISDPPPLLYYKGSMENADELCIAVVGTRKVTTYGRNIIPYIIEPLIDSGVVIVSGLAFGVDSVAQQLAASKGRRTIAVLGNGLDEKSFYPKEHILLADEIISSGGALVSQYPPGTPPLKHHFIARNRILAGVSVATVIIECGLKSGSLITAQHALEQDRTVYAVPGPIYSEQSKGPNNLIRMGATLVTEAQDILNDLNLNNILLTSNLPPLAGDNEEERKLLTIISKEPQHINDIIKDSGLSTQVTTSSLAFLEMKGKIRNLGGQQYVLAR